MANEPIDHSDQISKLKISIAFLMEWEPDGDWQDMPLYKKWEKSHYSLNTREFNTLTTALEKAHRELERQMYVKKYVQPNLFGGVDQHLI